MEAPERIGRRIGAVCAGLRAAAKTFDDQTFQRREVGRRISALRAGLHAATESLDELLLEAQERAPELAGQIEEAKADIEAALNREVRMREHDHKGGTG